MTAFFAESSAFALIAFIATLCLLQIPRSVALDLFMRLPSTVAHELSHWSVALLLGARPSFPNLIPRRTADGWLLGSVEFTPGLFSAGAVALAPTLNLTLCLMLLSAENYGLEWGSWATELGVGTICAYLFYGGLPSNQDIFIAIKYPIGTIIFGTAYAVAIYLAFTNF